MAAREVVDPAGIRWNVRRRWYAWHRLLSFRETLSNSPSEPAEPAPDAPADEESADSGLPRNVVLKVLLIVLAGLVWVLLGVGKILMYSAAIVLFVVLSLAELVLELLAMPVVLLLRLLGVARWPVQINRQGKHFATRYADGLASASALRDEVAGQIELGGLPSEDAAVAA
ncbi:hypothetical protein [Mycobacterium sp. URHB0044]|jgi:hypothetical protein|uniref:hypothetical protein n=1 Tax=Mycobacterium sp. URHB0044 TaxID=1380386 RepID=UPI000490013C|nr:hypothetical protein [Mycobacterium sp. URHB0044]